MRFGIQTLAPQFFGGPPEIVVSGPNVGSESLLIVKLSLAHSDIHLFVANLGTGTQGSGTVYVQFL